MKRKWIGWGTPFAGLLLLVFGLVLSLSQLSSFDANTIFHFWPLLMCVIGALNMVGLGYRKDRRRATQLQESRMQ